MIYPKDKCYFCRHPLEVTHKGDLKCSTFGCYDKHNYKVVVTSHHMIEFKIEDYWFEYYFGTEPDDRGMRVLSLDKSGYHIEREVIIDIIEDRHIFATKDNYLQVIEKCKTLRLFS